MRSPRTKAGKCANTALVILLTYVLIFVGLFPLNAYAVDELRSGTASTMSDDEGEGSEDPGGEPGGEDPPPPVTHTLAYHVSGDGTYGIPSDASIPMGETGIEEGATVSLAPKPTTSWTISNGSSGMSGSWTFTGWSSNASYSDTISSVTMNGDKTVYGKWTFTASQQGGDNPGGGGGDNSGGGDDDDPGATQGKPHIKYKFTVTNTPGGSSGKFQAGETVKLTIELENNGTEDAVDLIVTDSLDDLTFTKDTHDPLRYTIDKYGRVRIDRLKAGKKIEVYASYTVTDADADNGSFSHRVKTRVDDNAYTFESKVHTVETSKPADNPTGPYIARFRVGWGDPSYVKGLSTKKAKISVKDSPLQLGVILTWSDYSQTVPGSGMSISWSSSDSRIATVTGGGLVVPQGRDGTVTVTAMGYSNRTDPRDCQLLGSINIEVTNQENASAIKVFRVEGGAEIPESGAGSSLEFQERGQGSYQAIYATIEIDGTTYSSVDENPDIEWHFQAESIDVIACQYLDKGYTYVWAPEEGSKYESVLFVWAVKDGKRYVRMLPTTVDAPPGWQEGKGGMPPSKLTVEVQWENDPNPDDPALEKHEFSLSELNQMSTLRQAYTIVGDPTSDTKSFAYQTARGVKFVDLMSMCAVYQEDIAYIDVTGTDQAAVNSSLMDVSYFFGTPRYYYPNFYMGRNTSGAVPAFAMIAVCSNVYWQPTPETIEQKVNNLYSAAAELDAPDATQPRLCIGALGTYASGGKYSIKNVETIHVVLKGAPPAEFGGGSGSQGGSGDDDNGAGDNAGNGTGEGSKGDGDGSSGTGIGAADDGNSNSGSNDANGANATQGDSAGDQSSTADSADAQSNPSEGREGSAADDAAAMDVTADESGIGDGGHYSIYQMMSNAKTEVPISEPENPIAPYLVFIVDIIVLAGATRFTLWYMGQRKIPVPMKPTG